MCGIAGIVMRNAQPIPNGWVDNAKRVLRYQGPDGNSNYVSVKGNIALVHTRLAITDLANGNQPFVSDNGTLLIINGKIYNQQQLAANLSKDPFPSHSQHEIPLYLYLQHGIDGWQALRGMYAMALFDPITNAVLLARDPLGIKSLYYTIQPNYIAFASEISTLLETGLVPRHERFGAVASLFDQHYIPGKYTALEGVLRILPGEVVRIMNDGATSLQHFQPQKQLSNQLFTQVEPALEALNQTLRQSVRAHTMCNTSYGMFLSNSIDSAALLTLMAQELSTAPLAFTTFIPENPATRNVEDITTLCKATGVKHLLIPFGEQEFWQDLTAVALTIDDPIIDYAILPTYALAREARNHVKVILSSEGGNEFFAGYGRYRKLLRPWWLGGKKDLAAPRLLSLIPELRRYSITAESLHFKTTPHTRLTPYLQWECDHWLADNILIKLDRCLMAHGIEGRTPFTDREVGRLAWQFPDHFKINHGVGQWLLRMWLETQMPHAQAFSNKRRTTIPVDRWLMKVKDRLIPILQQQECLASWIHLDLLETAINKAPAQRAGRVLWGLLYYTLWHKLHIEHANFSNDVWEVLG